MPSSFSSACARALLSKSSRNPEFLIEPPEKWRWSISSCKRSSSAFCFAFASPSIGAASSMRSSSDASSSSSSLPASTASRSKNFDASTFLLFFLCPSSASSDEAGTDALDCGADSFLLDPGSSPS
eukprot:CAMPEP_0169334208 /NCGR_PEP_ID=MMETSP1017-20121227/15671_1 /TAXON_ID=342587 /ORGANISM="Karlodinium micrum, Strain CCMP2283" /LENGTH=125 /DNA_ID=CAMNT_0009429483 /DNA_START=124 /DNA_END=497 /DNA_ORIENTATION=+